MEEEDDDFYGGPTPVKEEDVYDNAHAGEDHKMEETAAPEDEEEDDDSDDDVQFTLEKPEGSKTDNSSQSRTTKQQPPSNDRAVSTDAKPARSSTPIKAEQQRTGSIQPAAVKSTLTHNGKEGKDFPEIRTSKVDVNGTPTWANGKPITEVDIDADLAEHSKPWRLPGTDQTDFFNYGFDEYTWAGYCVRQATMAGSIAEQKLDDANMKAMFGGGGGPGGPGGGMPGGMPPMPGMPGMPSPEEMMQQMIQQGMDPSDPNAFMMMMGGQMPGGGQGPQQQRGFGGGFGGQNTASPHPQGGQGFQPPSGPAAQNQGDQGFGGNMEGFSQQQIAIMQQQQGGGRRGGRGRGRWH